MKTAKRQFATLASAGLPDLPTKTRPLARRKCHFRQIVSLAWRLVSAFFDISKTFSSICLPKPRSAASALRAQALFARQLRRDRRAGKAWSGIHPAPCHKGIWAMEPQSWQRRQHKGNPASQCVTLYDLPPDSGLHAMKEERHGGPPSRARLVGTASPRNSSATPQWVPRGRSRGHRRPRAAPSLAGVALEDRQGARCGRRRRMGVGQGVGALGARPRSA